MYMITFMIVVIIINVLVDSSSIYNEDKQNIGEIYSSGIITHTQTESDIHTHETQVHAHSKHGCTIYI